MTEIPFDIALKRGLGRAVLLLRESNDNSAYRDAIQHACRTNLACDRYTERDRDRYLTDILEASQDLDWHLPRLRKALADPDSYFDQLALICSRLTRRGLADLREDLYTAWKDWFDDLEDGTHFDGAEALIRLDGVEGWRFVQRTLLTSAPTEYNSKSSKIEYFLYWILGDMVGVKAARHAGDSEPALRSAVARILNAKRRRQIDSQRKESQPLPIDLPTVRKVLSGEISGPSPGRLGRELSDTVLYQLALAMPEESDEETLRRWLRVFGYRAFPLDPTPLLALLEHSSSRIANKALTALYEVTHPLVRALAERFVATSDWRQVRVGSLLARNPGDNDAELIYQVFSVCKTDWQFHQFGLGLKEYYEHQPEKTPLALFETLYELTPCSLCRHQYVEILQERDLLPSWIAEEAQWDADEETRLLVSPQKDNDRDSV